MTHASHSLLHISTVLIKRPDERRLEYSEVFQNTDRAITSLHLNPKQTTIVITDPCPPNTRDVSTSTLEIIQDLVDICKPHGRVILAGNNCEQITHFIERYLNGGEGVDVYDPAKHSIPIISRTYDKKSLADYPRDTPWALVSGSLQQDRHFSAMFCDPGPLLQVNHWCAGQKHGFNYWKLTGDYLPLASPTFVHVPSSYGYVQVTISSPTSYKIKPAYEEWPPKMRLHYTIEKMCRLTEEDLASITTSISAMQDESHVLTDEPVIDGHTTDPIEYSLDPEVLSHLTPDNVTDLFAHLVPKSLHDMHGRVLAGIDPELLVIDHPPSGVELIRLRWRNVLSYPDRLHSVDFSHIKGIVLISGPNASGKSNILKMIKWALYNTENLNFIIHNHSKAPTAEITLEFSARGHTYTITRRYQRDGSGTKCIESVISEGEKEIKRAEGSKVKQIQEFSRWISTYFGSADDFDSSSFYSNTSDLPFFSERHGALDAYNKLMSHFNLTNLDEFTKVAKSIEDTIKGNKSKIEKQIEKKKIQLEHSISSQDITVTEEEVQEAENELAMLDECILRWKDERLHIAAQISKLKLEHGDVLREYFDVLEKNGSIPPLAEEEPLPLWGGDMKKTTLSDLRLISKICSDCRAEFVMQGPGAGRDGQPCDVVGWSDLARDLRDFSSIKSDYDDSVRVLESDLSPLRKISAIIDKSSLVDERGIRQIQAYLQELETNITRPSYAYRVTNREKSASRVSYHDQLNKFVSRALYQLHAMERNSEILRVKRLHQIEPVAKKIKKLQDRDETIRQKIAGEDGRHTDLSYDVVEKRQLLHLRQSAEEKIKTLEEEIKALTEELDEIDLYSVQQYIKFIYSLPVTILTDRLGSLQKHINDLLRQLVDYSLTFILSEKSVKTAIIKDGCSISISRLSGYEQFIIRFAVKFSLCQMKYSSVPRLFCIDEGLDCIDSENWPKVIALLQYLAKYQYSHLLVITHINPKIENSHEIHTSLSHADGKRFSRIEVVK